MAVIGALAVATTLGLHRFGLPATVGFLVTGAVAGPHGLGLVGDESHIELIAEIGVILLLFAVGLEFSLAALAMRNPASAAWRSGVYLAQFGEFGYVVLLLGVSVGLIGSAELQLVVTTSVVSIVLSRLLAYTLSQAGIPYVILELNTDSVRKGRREHAHVYYGDITSREALAHARIANARMLALLINDPAAIRRAIAATRAVSPHVPIMARARYVAERNELLALGAGLVVCEEVEGGTELAAHVLKSLGLDARAIRAQISHALASSQAADLTGAMEEWLEATNKQR